MDLTRRSRMNGPIQRTAAASERSGWRSRVSRVSSSASASPTRPSWRTSASAPNQVAGASAARTRPRGSLWSTRTQVRKSTRNTPRLAHRSLTNVPSDRPSENDWLLYAHYGQIMREAQLFELTIRHLFQLFREGPPRPDGRRLEDEVEWLFKQPLRQLAQRVGTGNLAEDVATAVNTRNTLAHEFLLLAYLSINTGQSSYDEQIGILRLAHRKFVELNASLDFLARKREAELGFDRDYSPEGIARIFRAETGGDR